MKMNRIFNTAGPCNPQDHYIIDPLRRLGKEVEKLISQKAFYIIHAARQTGKTTLLLDLADKLNEEGQYYALYCSLDKAETAETAEIGIPIILNAIYWGIVKYELPHPEVFEKYMGIANVYNSLQMALTFYCKSLDKPFVIFFDEADCLRRETLIPFLRQLRGGYVERARFPFIHSLALVGMRNIRDYRDEYRLPEQTLGDASPFNVITSSMTMRNFTQAEVKELYDQHTADTGQTFEEGAVGLAWRQTQGQPWLVNAIAYEIVMNITDDEPKEPISANMVSAAIQTLILRRDTHFDSLIARLHEGRVRRIIEPLIIGKEATISKFSEDYSYVKDLGIIRDDQGKVEPANPIYTEIIIRGLNADTQDELAISGSAYQMPRYLKNVEMDMDLLLGDFQTFWRENSDIWRKKYDYQEAAPQLILQAFLQRVLNGGGQIVREMAAATGRADLCVIYRDRKYPIEMKIRYDDKTYAEGTEQILKYMDILGCVKGWLVVFDHRGSLTWEDRIFSRKTEAGGKTVMVYGC